MIFEILARIIFIEKAQIFPVHEVVRPVRESEPFEVENFKLFGEILTVAHRHLFDACCHRDRLNEKDQGQWIHGEWLSSELEAT